MIVFIARWRAPEHAMLASGSHYHSLAAVAHAAEQLEHFHVYEPRPLQPRAAMSKAHEALGQQQPAPKQPASMASAGAPASVAADETALSAAAAAHARATGVRRTSPGSPLQSQGTRAACGVP